jgi:hypothetical protein
VNRLRRLAARVALAAVAGAFVLPLAEAQLRCTAPVAGDYGMLLPGTRVFEPETSYAHDIWRAGPLHRQPASYKGTGFRPRRRRVSNSPGVGCLRRWTSAWQEFQPACSAAVATTQHTTPRWAGSALCLLGQLIVLQDVTGLPGGEAWQSASCTSPQASVSCVSWAKGPKVS